MLLDGHLLVLERNFLYCRKVFVDKITCLVISNLMQTTWDTQLRQKYNPRTVFNTTFIQWDSTVASIDPVKMVKVVIQLILIFLHRLPGTVEFASYKCKVEQHIPNPMWCKNYPLPTLNTSAKETQLAQIAAWSTLISWQQMPPFHTTESDFND